ncbi:MAG: adenosylmethionine--8-amino-7-oxononanoate transaminase [Candidatus Nitrospinota bacterium M3_3B_026]
MAPKNLQKSYEERDKKYVWHPFTQMKEWMEEPIVVVESGDGITVRDVRGREFMDLFSSYWCNVHGHGDERLNAAIGAQLGKISHSTFLGLSNVPAVDLAEKLAEITPEGLDRVFYSDDGSTAVEAALKMSYQYWRHTEPRSRRDRFIAVEGAYHGDTMGAMSVGGIDIYHEVFRDLLAKTVFVPPPYCYRCPIGKSYPDCAIACAGLIDEALAANEGRVAAMIIEPLVQCPGGIITAPHGYLKRAAEACARHGVLLIADEVAVGFGRTGRMFACEHESVRPDIMTVSKSITGGTMPFAATIASSRVFDAFWGDYRELKTFFHGHTYTANQLGAAAALENLRLMDERDIIGQAQEKAAELSAVLARFQDLEHVGDVRQRGLIAGVELVADKETKKTYHWTERMGARVVLEARGRGLLARPLGDVLVLFPAPFASIAEVRKMTDILYDSIAAVTE